jgi:ActR/RegA family two-component response regulator
VRAAVAAGSSGNYNKLKSAKKSAVAAVERAFAEAVMAAIGRNASRAARHCGIHRAQWQRLMHAEAAEGEEKLREIDHKSSPSSKTDT